MPIDGAKFLTIKDKSLLQVGKKSIFEEVPADLQKVVVVPRDVFNPEFLAIHLVLDEHVILKVKSGIA